LSLAGVIIANFDGKIQKIDIYSLNRKPSTLSASAAKAAKNQGARLFLSTPTLKSLPGRCIWPWKSQKPDCFAQFTLERSEGLVMTFLLCGG
jgi:hypothetical protein